MTDANPVDPRVEIQAALGAAGNYNRWIADQAGGFVGNRVLDAGSGAGNLARLLLDDRELVVGVDEWDEFTELAQRELAATGRFVSVNADLTDPALPTALREHRLDSAICSNVLEHIPDDAAALANIAASLPSGAPVFVLVPAFMALYGAHDRADHHLRRYTKRSFARLVDPLPLDVEQAYYMNLPGFFAWFAVGRVLRRQLQPADVGLYDRLVPAIRAVETRIHPPIGQSLIVLLRVS
jgi:SAM-dependent methyltransferase